MSGTAVNMAGLWFELGVGGSTSTALEICMLPDKGANGKRFRTAARYSSSYYY